MIEVDCSICGAYAEHHNCKQVCIHCFNLANKKIKMLEKQLDKLDIKLVKQRHYQTNFWEMFYPDGTSSMFNYNPLLKTHNLNKESSDES